MSPPSIALLATIVRTCTLRFSFDPVPCSSGKRPVLRKVSDSLDASFLIVYDARAASASAVVLLVAAAAAGTADPNMSGLRLPADSALRVAGLAQH